MEGKSVTSWGGSDSRPACIPGLRPVRSAIILAPMSAPATSLSVKLLLFATYAELAGREQVTLEVPSPATVADVVRFFRASCPGADQVPDRPMAAVNRVHARPETVVTDGDEIALLPPLAGG